MPPIFLQTLNQTIDQLVKEFDSIPDERKQTLTQLTRFIRSRVDSKRSIYLNFICTHNNQNKINPI